MRRTVAHTGQRTRLVARRSERATGARVALAESVRGQISARARLSIATACLVALVGGLHAPPLDAAVAGPGVGSSPASSVRHAAGPLRITSPSDGLAILREGGTLRLSESIERITFWRPLFGARRSAVNPARPTLVGRAALRFEVPGEYYLRLNGHRYARALILPIDAPPRVAFLSLFDFYLANSANTDADDALIVEDPAAYIRGFFVRHRPAAIHCGPTQAFLAKLIRTRLGLPVRFTVLPGGGRWPDGSINFGVHNVLEVYLPDVGKWVHVDANGGVLPKWRSTLEVSRVLRGALGARDVVFSREEWTRVASRLRLHENVVIRQVRAPSIGPYDFRRAYVTRTATRREYWRQSYFLAGGPAYHLSAYAPNPPIRRILDADLVFTDGWAEAEVRDATVEKWTPQGFRDAVLLQPDEMERLLARAYAPALAKRGWERWFGPVGPSAARRTRSAS